MGNQPSLLGVSVGIFLLLALAAAKGGVAEKGQGSGGVAAAGKGPARGAANGGGERTASAVESYLRRRLGDAEAACERGELERALAMARGILALEPALPFRRDVRRLIRRCEGSLAGRDDLRAELLLGPDVIEFGREASAELVLHNVSRDTIRIVVDARTRFLGELTLHGSTAWWDGVRVEHPRKEWLRADRTRLELEPGERWRTRIAVKAHDLKGEKRAVRRVRLGGWIRPQLLAVGGRNIPHPLAIPEVEVFFVPVGRAEEAVDPVHRLAANLLLDRAEGAFVAGMIAVWSGEGEDLVEPLMKALETVQAPADRVVMVLLRQATGEGLPFERLAWFEWYRRRAEGKAPPD